MVMDDAASFMAVGLLVDWLVLQKIIWLSVVWDVAWSSSHTSVLV